MFLSLVRVPRALRRIRDDEHGVALPTVIIFMFAGVLLSLVVASTVMYSYTFSSSTRASVQSQASAEAGIAAARAGLLENECTTNGGLFKNDDPYYRVQVFRPNGTGGWTPGCPSIAEDARIVSLGDASSKGVNGDATGDQATIEAILGSFGSDTALTASGPAIFAYSASGAGAGGRLVSLDGTNVDVMLSTGTVVCDGGFQGAANVVVKSGTLNAVAGCNLAGNVWVNGTVNISGGASIGGSVTAGEVNISNGSVAGNIWADNLFNGTNGTVGGWVSAGKLQLGGANVGAAWSRNATSATMSGGRVRGVLTVNGPLTITGGTLEGPVVAAGAVSTSTSVSGGISAGGDVTVTGGTTTGVTSTGTLRLNGGNVNGTVRAVGFAMSNSWSTIAGGTFSGAGCFTTSGAINGAMRVASVSSGAGCQPQNNPAWWWNGFSLTVGPSAAPPAPTLAGSPIKPPALTVPNWIDFGSKPEHFTDAGWRDGSGTPFTVVPIGGNCTQLQIYNALNAIGTAPGVIDARGCSNGIQLTGSGTEYTGPFGWGDDLSRSGFTLKADLAIIANKFDLGGSGRFTGAGTGSQLWLINPDTIANQSPDCAAGQQLKIDGGFTFQKLSTMIYSPCKVVIGSSTKLTGQIFAGQTQIAGGATVTYTAVGLPGFDLNLGEETSVTASEWQRPIVSQRNISG